MLPQLEVTPVVQKTLQMLASRDRMALLPDIVEAYRSRLMDHQKVVRASVTSAVPLPVDGEARSSGSWPASRAARW